MDGFIKLDNGVDENHLPLIVIIGPTASGKTSLVIQLAKKYRGEIICADSRTVYCGMNIGTAKPSLGEQQGVSHWGLDLVDPGDSFSVSQFKDYACQKIKEIRSRGNIPFLVGGTGLYIDSVIFDFQFGNSMENLPISAHYSKNFDFNEKSEYNLHLTEKDFIKVEKSSLSYWNKCSLIQTILCTLLLTVVLVLLGFVFSNFVFKVIFYIIDLALVSFVFVVLNRKRKELYKKLFIFSNKKYF